MKNRILLFLTFFILTFCQAQSRKFTIVLDAGHGGHDTGAKGVNGVHEKTITLQMVKKVGDKLKAKFGKDISVIYTREQDRFVTLQGRAVIATSNHADLFISLHCNSNPSSKPSGSETYVLGLHRTEDNFEVAKKENAVILLEKDYKVTYKNFDPNSAESVIGLTLLQDAFLGQSIDFANTVQQQFKSVGRVNRGVKQAGFLILRESATPSVLVEMGFISNAAEASYLSSSAGQNKLAESIAKAVASYKMSFDSKKSGKSIAANSSNTSSGSVKSSKTTNSTSVKPIYKVQISASTSKIDTKSSNFKGLKGVSRLQSGSKYIYVYTETTDYSVAKSKLSYVQKNGYPGAFIYAIYKGKRIAVKEALKK